MFDEIEYCGVEKLQAGAFVEEHIGVLVIVLGVLGVMVAVPDDELDVAVVSMEVVEMIGVDVRLVPIGQDNSSMNFHEDIRKVYPNQ